MLGWHHVISQSDDTNYYSSPPVSYSSRQLQERNQTMQLYVNMIKFASIKLGNNVHDIEKKSFQFWYCKS